MCRRISSRGDPWTGAFSCGLLIKSGQTLAREARKARIHSGEVRGKPGSCQVIELIEADCMVRYIDEILQPGEKVLYSTSAHWIFYLPAILAWILALALLGLSRATTTEGIILLCLSASAIVAFAAAYWTIRGWFHRFTTETDVTDR